MSTKFVKVGRRNKLKVVDQAGFGVFLDGQQFDEILLPKRFVPDGCKVGDELDVFVYLDSDDCLIATTETPKAQVGDFAFLTVKEVNKVGAFLDWNLGKDLLAPYREQRQKMQAGQSYVVYLYQDEHSRRIVASSKLNKFVQPPPSGLYKQNQPVDLLISERTDLGYMAIINNRHSGLIFDKEGADTVRIGDKVKGYIKRVRPDQKIDLSLSKPGFSQDRVDDLGQKILDLLDEHDGYLAMNDRSAPADISRVFAVSKRAFKMSLGGLYKKRLITIEERGIRRFTPE